MPSAIRSAAFASTLPCFQEPQINYVTRRWEARHPARPGRVVTVEGANQTQAKYAGGIKLNVGAERVYVNEVFDPSLTRLNRRA
jgi:hypothetical protein